MPRMLLAGSILSALLIPGMTGCASHSAAPLKPQQFQAAQEKAAALAAATTMPATVPFTASSGQSLTVGTVVAEANGQPIYADKVLAKIEKPLEEKARQLEARPFRAFASELIKKAVVEEISDELEFAAAQRNLTDEDRHLAEMLTMQWRQKRITDAGGVIALAKDQVRQSEGMEFDDACQRQFRLFNILIYQERRIKPRVQVSATDMRRFYESNCEKLFTEQASITFRLIKIDPERSGTEKDARDKVNDILRKLQAGEDFAGFAHNCDDEFLRNHDGLAGTIQKGAYKDREIEEAAWKIQPGQISEKPFEYQKAFYIIKVEARKIGRVAPFEDEKTQDSIRNSLRNAQMSKLRQEEQARLWNSAFTRFDEAMLTPAVDMAMQKYVIWTGK